MISYEQYLRASAVPKRVIDVFLAQSEPTWARFDPEVGYRLGSSLPHDGLDGSWTLSSCQANGARTARQYTERPCRINTYGNSFTQCHQVSDGETWQEYLAAHLGEPVRNFGMGGYGVYDPRGAIPGWGQACRFICLGRRPLPEPHALPACHALSGLESPARRDVSCQFLG